MSAGLGWYAAGLTALMLLSNAASAATDSCALHSPNHRVTVLELYTSEGCNSCPPADRWLSGLPQRGVSAQKAVVLAFHVDYWNRLGWPDRFSQAAFSERQRDLSARNHARAIYTPQTVLDGLDLRGAYYQPQLLEGRLAAINREAGGAVIQAELTRESTEVRVRGDIKLTDLSLRNQSETWIAVYENGLSSQVTAGENAGRQLYHDFVVRQLAGPFRAEEDGRTRIDQRIRIAADWRAERLGVAVFVQRRDTGAVLQATAAQVLCPS